MHGNDSLALVALVVVMVLSGPAHAETDPASSLPGGTAGGETPALPAVPVPSVDTSALPGPAQVEAWLAAARALKQARPELFGEAEGVLATQVQPGGQGVAAGVEPGAVLIAYGNMALDSASQFISQVRETPAGETVTLRWLRLAAADAAELHEAQVHGGRLGIGVQDVTETPQARIRSLLGAGLMAWQRSANDEAMGLLEQGLAVARSENDQRAQAAAHGVIGMILTQSGRHLEALQHFTEALASDRALGDRAGEGTTLSGLGRVNQSLGRYPEALEHFTQALAIGRALGDRAGEGLALNGLGSVNQSLGRYPEALEHYTQALAIGRALGDRAGEGVALTGLGGVNLGLGHYTEALEHYTQALAIDRALGNRAGEGFALNGLGIVNQSLGRYPDAVDYFTQAIAVHAALGDRAAEGNALNTLGFFESSLSRFPAAVEHCTQALAIHRELGDRAGQSGDLTCLGGLSQRLGRYPKAVEQFTEALNIHHALGDRAGEAVDLGSLGETYLRLGRYPEALEHDTQALAIDREIGERTGEGTDLANLGALYQGLGRYPEALEHHRQALAIQRERGDRALQGAVLSSLSVVYRELGRYPEALEQLRQALTIRRETGNRADEGIDLGNFGDIYYRLGRYPEAIKYYTQALAIDREIGNRDGEGTHSANLGTAYRTLGRYSEALEQQTQALAISREIGNRGGEGDSLANLGTIYLALGRYPEAIDDCTQALTIHRAIGDHARESMDILNLGVLHAALGQTDEARGYTLQSLVLQADLDVPETLWLSWNNLRQFLLADSQSAPAILAGKRAVNIIQAMRTTNASLPPEQQQSFLKGREHVYRQLAELLAAQGRYAEAQQVLDMLKEQELYDYIKEEGAYDPRQTRAGYNAIEAGWLAAYDGTAGRLAPLARRFGELNRIKPEVRTEFERAEIEHLSAERDALSADLQRQLAALPEHFAAIDRKSQADEDGRFASSQDTKRALLAALTERSGTRTGLLQFVVLPDKVRLLLTTPDGWRTAVAEIGEADLKARIDTLAAALKDPTRPAVEPARALYDAILAPLAAELDAARLESLLVHLDGRLRYIPFGALHDSRQWLAQRWPIVYYTAASERRPELASKDSRVAGLGTTRAYPGFTALPAVKDEIEGIVRHGKKDRTGVLPGTVHFDQEFTESVLRGEAGNPANRILHIASHFDLKRGNDTQSSLLLGTGDTLSLHDLREHEPRLDLRHLDLVTLSACNTAMGGADDTGAEIDGMGAIMLRQGAHGVLASLWPVADASTGALMQRFYKLRVENPGLTKAQALQQAQLALMGSDLVQTSAARGKPRRDWVPDGDEPKQEGTTSADRSQTPTRYAHPYYWAPFILMGNWL